MSLTIGDVAAAADVNVETIRYYERRGLVAPARRRYRDLRQLADACAAREPTGCPILEAIEEDDVVTSR